MLRLAKSTRCCRRSPDTTRNSLADLALAQRLPAATLLTDFARDGGLIAYGPNLLAFYRQQSVLGAKILQGRTLPTCRLKKTTEFEFVLNIKTAKLLGVTVP